MGGICGVWKIPSRKVISSDEQLFGQEYWRGEGRGTECLYRQCCGLGYRLMGIHYSISNTKEEGKAFKLL